MNLIQYFFIGINGLHANVFFFFYPRELSLVDKTMHMFEPQPQRKNVLFFLFIGTLMSFVPIYGRLLNIHI